MAKVFLTDDPFPFDSVQSVKVYIVSIAVSTHPDTGTSADNMQWDTVAAPHRQVDLLTLQQGLTDSLGIGEVTADQYKAVLVTIDVDSSEGIRFKGGSPAVVRWNGSGRESYASFVEAPISIPFCKRPSDGQRYVLITVWATRVLFGRVWMPPTVI